MVKGKIFKTEAKNAVIDLGDGIEGQLRAADVSIEAVKDVREYLKVDEEVDVKIIVVDRKNRVINLSLKALQEERARENDDSNVGGGTTLGDLLKEQIEKE